VDSRVTRSAGTDVVVAKPARPGVWDPVRRWLGRTWLGLFGWRVEGEIPDTPRFVAVAAPHTSYWDFPHMMAFGFATGQYISFLMKASLFVGPCGWLFRSLGGIPVDRSRAGGLVESVAREFERRSELIVVIAPEGTRARGDAWKSGFHRLALRAGVPIALGYLDYGRKIVGYGPLYWPSPEGDEALLASFYADKQGRHPGQETPPRLHHADR
jgi:1-acyl-sn-glycerol-3-phosphate acyltransferase